jgi:hypothetical protein
MSRHLSASSNEAWILCELRQPVSFDLFEEFYRLLSLRRTRVQSQETSASTDVLEVFEVFEVLYLLVYITRFPSGGSHLHQEHSNSWISGPRRMAENSEFRDSSSVHWDFGTSFKQILHNSKVSFPSGNKNGAGLFLKYHEMQPNEEQCCFLNQSEESLAI